jgi:hypothetical protein
VPSRERGGRAKKKKSHRAALNGVMIDRAPRKASTSLLPSLTHTRPHSLLSSIDPLITQETHGRQGSSQAFAPFFPHSLAGLSGLLPLHLATFLTRTHSLAPSLLNSNHFSLPLFPTSLSCSL